MKKLLIIFLLILCFDGFSQGDPADGDALVPIDGGFSMLLASCAIYEAKKIRDNALKGKE